RAHSAADDCADLDSVLPSFDVQGMAKSEQAPLAGVVRRGVGPSPFRCGRDNVHHMAASLTLHERPDAFAQHKWATQVGLYDAVPIVEGKLVNGQSFVGAGVVDQDVESTVAIDNAADEIDRLGIASDVELCSENSTSLVWKPLCQSLHQIAPEVGSND